MPPDAPTPITPNGKRAAEKIRNIFACIVAANLALVAIVVWQGFFGKSGGSRAKQDAFAMEQILERSIAAYNAGDRETFSALFSTTRAALESHATGARSSADGALSPAALLEKFRREFGKVIASKPASSSSPPGGDGATLVRDITCEKHEHARLVAKFVREADAVKIVEWRIEKR